MSDLWFYEQRMMGGGWSPCTSADQPVTVSVNGMVRLKRGEGVGPRVRRVQKVPPHLHGKSLDEIRAGMPEAVDG